MVIKGDQVLLCQRGKPPNLGSWTLPGGAQELGETCEQAARRELLEECGLEVGPLHFCAHVDTIRRDDDGPRAVPLHDPRFCRALGGGRAGGGLRRDRGGVGADGRAGDYELWCEAHRMIAIARRLVA